MSMEYVNLGKTGLKVSRICLGCMSYGEVPTVIRPSGHAWALNEEQSQPSNRRGFGHQLLGHEEHTSRSRYGNELP